MKTNYNSNELLSRCVKAGSRTYFIDAKQDSYGHNYMVISEVRSNLKTGTKERNRFFLYEEDFASFSQSLAEVMAYVKELKKEPEADGGTLVNKLEIPVLEDIISLEEE